MTLPTKTLLQGKVYVPAEHTDIRKTFAEARARQRIASFYQQHQDLVPPKEPITFEMEKQA